MKFTCTLFISGLLLLSQATHAQTLKIKTIAGTGTLGYSNDGLAATDAQLYGPINVAVDKGENVYVVDYFNLRVRKINVAGIITTVAGTGIGGNTGDSTLASTARVDPQAIAVDKHGNLYIADGVYSVIRKVNTLGIISTIAGTGTGGYSGDNGLAIHAMLNGPRGIAVDTSDNVYIADALNNVIRKIDGATGVINTIAGNDTAGYLGDYAAAIHAELDSPYAVAVNKWGTVYITDYKNDVVRSVDTNGLMHTYAGVYNSYGRAGDNGAAAFAQLNGPAGIAVDTAGNLFIADANNNVIRKVSTGGIITTVVGNGTAGFGGDLGYALGANLLTPFGVAVDIYGNIFIADANNERVREAFNPELAVTSPLINTAIDVYPNPAAAQITLSDLTKGDKVTLYDMQGRQVCTWDIVANGARSFDIQSLVSGIYMLRISNAAGNNVAVARVVKD